jgi:excisionase family DNA binding protein
MANASKVLTVKELCHYLRVHQSTVYRLLKKGMLPGFKVGSDWRFNIEAIDRWRLEQGGRLISENANSRLARG